MYVSQYLHKYKALKLTPTNLLQAPTTNQKFEGFSVNLLDLLRKVLVLKRTSAEEFPHAMVKAIFLRYSLLL